MKRIVFLILSFCFVMVNFCEAATEVQKKREIVLRDDCPPGGKISLIFEEVLENHNQILEIKLLIDSPTPIFYYGLSLLYDCQKLKFREFKQGDFLEKKPEENFISVNDMLIDEEIGMVTIGETWAINKSSSRRGRGMLGILRFEIRYKILAIIFENNEITKIIRRPEIKEFEFIFSGVNILKNDMSACWAQIDEINILYLRD